jgi:hypothetical protein
VAGLRKKLNAITDPKKRAEVNHGKLENLNDNTALILFAIAEAVLGENFLRKAPKFIETVDDYLNYQRPAQRDLFLRALRALESGTLKIFVGVNTRRFSHKSLADRQKILEELRSSKREGPNIYAAFVNVSASTYYASDLTWPDLGYEGVSVDHPEILNRPPPPPWRRNDLRPIEP